MTKKLITPEKYKEKKTDYQDASKLRAEEVRRLRAEGWTQQRIADYFEVDIAIINRILKDK